MEPYTSLRLLPWSTPDGKPCYLANGEDGYVSRLADEREAQQLADGLDVLERARRVLEDPLSPHVEVRYGAIRLTECLADALRIAESRGRRLPRPAAEGGDHDVTTPGDAPGGAPIPERSS
ncbi:MULTISPECIES: hypothetical protein [unclassified Streptomyces]|uniref:hypothetical protein n=1 Tax=unclassified Streptomyces TaxID=2593676 RepID=UPI001F53090E|nr:hypothetical protein [Streptomyces sp. DH-12]